MISNRCVEWLLVRHFTRCSNDESYQTGGAKTLFRASL